MATSPGSIPGGAACRRAGRQRGGTWYASCDPNSSVRAGEGARERLAALRERRGPRELGDRHTGMRRCSIHELTGDAEPTPVERGEDQVDRRPDAPILPGGYITRLEVPASMGGEIPDRQVAHHAAVSLVQQCPGVFLVVLTAAGQLGEGGEVVAALPLRQAGKLVGEPAPRSRCGRADHRNRVLWPGQRRGNGSAGRPGKVLGRV